jgi:UDP-N-acetylmuramoyl-tripeptide--D-alanyl-D-alanine ligase
LIGSYNFTNCAAAILMGKYFNVPLQDIKNAIEGYSPKNNRSQILEKNGHRIILDAYNANPTSMVAALTNFKQMEGRPKIAFLGDMFELGKTSAKEHQAIAELAGKMEFEKVFLIGSNFYKTDTGLKSNRHKKLQTPDTQLRKLESFEVVSEYLKENPITGTSTILIKGSRGMALERILELL